MLLVFNRLGSAGGMNFGGRAANSEACETGGNRWGANQSLATLDGMTNYRPPRFFALGFFFGAAFFELAFVPGIFFFALLAKI
jgi:hypothetical protein